VVAILLVLVLLAATLIGGISTYRRTLGRGPYEGKTSGALGLASVLGLFLGVGVALSTLALVLIIRQAR
jgi:hypothetical protein